MAAHGPPFDLLVTDIVMPGMRGDQIAARLLDQGRVRRVLFMSGYHDGQLDTRGGRLLAKPFAVRDLIEAVQATLAAPCTAQAGDAEGSAR